MQGGDGHPTAGLCHVVECDGTCMTRHTGPRGAKEAVAEPTSLTASLPAPAWWSDQYICRASRDVRPRVRVTAVCFSPDGMLSEVPMMEKQAEGSQHHQTPTFLS